MPGYNLRKAINTTPRAHRSVIDSASRQAMRSPSPSARSGLPSNPNDLAFVNQPLSQPQFNIPQRPSDEDEIVFAPTSDSNNSTQPATSGSFLTGPGSYSLVDFFGPSVDESEMQSFCADANVEITPSPPPDQPVLKGSIPANPFPAAIPNNFPAATPLSAQEQAQSDQRHHAFLLANGFTSLATNISRASTSGAPANTNFPTLIPDRFPPVHPLSDEEKARSDRRHLEFLDARGFNPVPDHFPPVRPLSDEEKVHSDRKRLEFLIAQGFTTQPEQHKASTSGTSAGDHDREVDYNLPAEDENDSRCPSGLDDSDAPNEEDHEIVSGTGKARQRAGRIPNDTWKKLKSVFLKLDSDLDQLASDTGCTHENIISLWQNTHSLKRAYLSAWNIYEIYFREHRPQERKRVGNPKATCEFPIPSGHSSIDAANRCGMFQEVQRDSAQLA